MNVRVIGTEGEISSVIKLLKQNFEVVSVSDLKVSRDDPRASIGHIDIMSEDQKLVCGAPSEAQVLDYLVTWHSKKDVMHYFRISWEKSEEILERLYSNGAVLKELDDRSYVYHVAVPLPEDEVIAFCAGSYKSIDAIAEKFGMDYKTTVYLLSDLVRKGAIYKARWAWTYTSSYELRQLDD